MARRSPWINDRAALLVRLLAERGFEVSEDTAREDISSHVDLVAERMRIGRQAAKAYITNDFVQRLADHIARTVNRHQVKAALDPRHLRLLPPPP